MDEDGDFRRKRQRAARRRGVLAAAAIGLIALLGLAAVFGPLLVSGNYHRGAIERLASHVVGRPVFIEGRITLSLLPDPQLVAEDVIIGGPHGAQATASVLKLELSPGPLLFGRLRAHRLTLRRPDINLPWPLPGGAGAIAPPPWLGSLHATIDDGTFHVGPLRLDHANLSIFTGGPRAVIAAGGTMRIGGVEAAMTLDIDDTGSTGPAPVTATLKLRGDGHAELMFHGTLGHDSFLAGALEAKADKTAVAGLLPALKASAAPFDITARLAATGQQVRLDDVTLRAGAMRAVGDTVLALAPAPLLRVTARATGVDLDLAAGLVSRLRRQLPVAAALDVSGTLSGLPVNAARGSLLADDASLRAQLLSAPLPGQARLGFSGEMSPALNGHFTLQAQDPAATLAILRHQLPYLPAWPGNAGRLDATGMASVTPGGTLALDDVAGHVAMGPALTGFTAALRLTPSPGQATRIAARIDLDRLTLDQTMVQDLLATLSDPAPRYAGPVRIAVGTLETPARRPNESSRVVGRDLRIDASLRDKAAGGGLHIRLATLRMGGALLIGRGLRKADGEIVRTRLFLAGPDASREATTLAKAFGLPAAWDNHPAFRHDFSLTALADGRPDALATHIRLRIGMVRAAARPRIDLAAGTAAGSLAVRAPNAARLILSLGGASLLGERQGLGWPGPGSASLSAAGYVTPGDFGLSDFVASLGALTLSGRVDVDTAHGPRRIFGRMTADTLPLPAPAMLIELAHAALGSDMRIDMPRLTAARIERYGETLARRADFGIRLDQGKLAPHLSIDIGSAGFAGGKLSGRAVLTGASGSTPPTLSLRARLAGGDSQAIAALAASHGLDLPLAGGTLDIGADLMAQGDERPAWLHTLSGSVTATSHDISLRGLNLAAAGQALAAATRAPHPIGMIAASHMLRSALSAGHSAFSLLNLTATLGDRTIRLDHAALSGPAGSMSANGHLDLVGDRVELELAVHPTSPDAKPGPELSIDISGPTSHPKRRVDIAKGIFWIRHALAAAKPGPAAPPPR